MVKTFKKAAVLALAVAIIAGFVVSTTGSAFADQPNNNNSKHNNNSPWNNGDNNPNNNSNNPPHS